MDDDLDAKHAFAFAINLQSQTATMQLEDRQIIGRSKATLVRFADDFVMTFETYQDAKRVMEVLGKRLGRFGLTLHPDKTHFIDFRPQRHGGMPPDCKVHSFDFLGFTHSWAKSRKGKNVVRQTTAKSRFARSLATVKDWCRTHRHLSPREQRAWLTAVLNGHFAYYAQE